jgi:hypothetical protein
VSDIEVQLDDLREALSEVDVLAVVAREAFGDADWTDSSNVDAMAALLRLIERSSYAAMSAYHRLHRVVADAHPAGEAWDQYDKGEPNAPGRDAELLKRDADIVRRLRERMAEAFDCPTTHPFFRRDWLPGEGADEAILRIYRSNQQVLERSDDDVINAIVEHARHRGYA